MPTTTNFGWTTPADTDLVKDGAAAIRTLGSNIDTSLVDLKGGTTGQYLQKNSGTDLDYVWADVSAGGMTLLSTTSLSGTSVTISSISQSYNNLVIFIEGMTCGSNFVPRIAPNASTNITTYSIFASSSGSLSNSSSTYLFLHDAQASYLSNSVSNTYTIIINDYANSASNSKNFSGSFSFVNNSSVQRGGGIAGRLNTTAITSLVFTEDSAQSFLTGTVRIYGVK